jgi:hypothetical protein
MLGYSSSQTQYKLFRHKNGTIIPCICTRKILTDQNGEFISSINTYMPLPDYEIVVDKQMKKQA